jgi:hypothetical protein
VQSNGSQHRNDSSSYRISARRKKSRKLNVLINDIDDIDEICPLVHGSPKKALFLGSFVVIGK